MKKHGNSIQLPSLSQTLPEIPIHHPMTFSPIPLSPHNYYLLPGTSHCHPSEEQAH